MDAFAAAAIAVGAIIAAVTVAPPGPLLFAAGAEGGGNASDTPSKSLQPSAADSDFLQETGHVVSEREKNAFDAYAEAQRRAGGGSNRLYAKSGSTFLLDHETASRQAMLDIVLPQLAGHKELRDFLSGLLGSGGGCPGAAAAGPGSTSDDAQGDNRSGDTGAATATTIGETGVMTGATIRIADSGLFMNLNAAKQQLSCPSARRVAWAKIPGVKRVFNFPSITLLTKGISPLPRERVAEISNQPTKRKEKGTKPIAAVLELPGDCFLRFAWIYRYFDLVFDDVRVVEEDYKSDIFLATGETMKVVFPRTGLEQNILQRIGILRFGEVVEEFALTQPATIAPLLGDKVPQAIEERCVAETRLESASKTLQPTKALDLRYCFFNIDRMVLFRDILGSRIFGEELMKGLGLKSVWQNHELQPNMTYVKAVLCGAKEESWSLIRHLVEKSYLADGTTTLKSWLLSTKLSIEVDENVTTLPGLFLAAGKCTRAFLRNYIKALPQEEIDAAPAPTGETDTVCTHVLRVGVGEPRISRFFRRTADFFKNGVASVKDFFRQCN